jgi:hypothetical protein
LIIKLKLKKSSVVRWHWHSQQQTIVVCHSNKVPKIALIFERYLLNYYVQIGVYGYNGNIKQRIKTVKLNFSCSKSSVIDLRQWSKARFEQIVCKDNS